MYTLSRHESQEYSLAQIGDQEFLYLSYEMMEYWSFECSFCDAFVVVSPFEDIEYGFLGMGSDGECLYLCYCY